MYLFEDDAYNPNGYKRIPNVIPWCDIQCPAEMLIHDVVDCKRILHTFNDSRDCHIPQFNKFKKEK